MYEVITPFLEPSRIDVYSITTVCGELFTVFLYYPAQAANVNKELTYTSSY